MDNARENEIKEIMRACWSDCCEKSTFEDLQAYGLEHKKSQSFAQVLEFLNALASKDRLLIVKTLKERGEQCVCELEAILDKSQPSISHHLRHLERVSLIRGWKKGKFTYYVLMENEYKKYLDLLQNELK
ncbi:MAG: winged helix-turn-helix transcriptional regulator [Candidatus Lokiarchaeota archaeon]|nr:winged helix-turn-helix transcriptional regulator [Candidatus Lokiarchaeota archaeon]